MVEEEATCELSSFESALIHLMGAYFTYYIAYPKPLQSLLLMIQHRLCVWTRGSQPDDIPKKDGQYIVCNFKVYITEEFIVFVYKLFGYMWNRDEAYRKTDTLS